MKYLLLATKLIQVALLLLVGAWALSLLTRPDPMEQRRFADAQLSSGQYHSAFQLYRQLADTQPSGPVFLRLGILHALRGEHRPAVDRLRQARRRPLSPHERALAFLYLGREHARLGQAAYAENAFGQLLPADPLYPLRLILEAEQALAREDYPAAEASLRHAAEFRLPPGWRPHLRYRLALLVAARDGDAALKLLTATAPELPLPLHAALLPLSPPQLQRQQAYLSTVLGAAPDQRRHLLGQLFLDARLYTLADAQFAQVPSDSSAARSAAAYAAYTRWQVGDRSGGLSRLRQLVAQQPDDPRARSLLAIAYLQLQQPQDAAAQLEAIGQARGADPLVYLAWGQWFFVQRDYVQAAEQYRRAVDAAPSHERAGHAITAARFHLQSSYAVCDEGLPVAQQAAALGPELAEAWTALAALSYHCRAPRAAREAALRALRLAPDSAEASYYLGVALASLGEPYAARAALTRAADLEPASVWRVRAESQLQLLPS
jgi:tetratricopeptide (TPR) repeat protein